MTPESDDPLLSSHAVPSTRHGQFDELLDTLKFGNSLSPEIFGRVLERICISRPESVPRVDIAQGTMLDQPSQISQTSVSRAVQAMIDAKLLAEEAPLAVRPGRPIKPLRVNGDSRSLVGVHVGHRGGHVNSLFGVALTLDGVELGREELSLEGEVLSVETLAKRLEEVISFLVGPATDGGRQVLGAGIEIGGHVFRGELVDYSNGGWHRVDLGGHLRKRFPFPVIIENDIKVRAIRESYNVKNRKRDFAVVAVFDEGVGGALVGDGRLRRGWGGLAGEIGHISVQFESSLPERGTLVENPTFNDPCQCGFFGHLEALATPTRIAATLRIANCADAAVRPVESLDGSPTREAEAFTRAGLALGRGLATLASLYNPGRLHVLLPPALINYETTQAGSRYLASVEAVLDTAISTAAQDARSGQRRLTVTPLDSANVPFDGASAAATSVIDAFIQHARGRDDCTDEKTLSFEAEIRPISA